eukprot:scaffold17508_cov64-Phaeocystis_antarctica.AAC.1
MLLLNDIPRAFASLWSHHAGFHKRALDGYVILVPRSGTTSPLRGGPQTTTWPRRGAATRH